MPELSVKNLRAAISGVLDDTAGEPDRVGKMGKVFASGQPEGRAVDADGKAHASGPSRKHSKGAFRSMFNKDASEKLDDGGFKSFDEFVRAIYRLHKHKQFDERLVSKTLETGIDSGAGYLVPTQYSSQLIDEALEREIVRPRATTYAMSGTTLRIPAYTITDHGATLSNVSANWVDEGEEATQTDPKFRQVELKAKKLVCYAKVTEEMLADSAIPMSQVIGDKFSQAISLELDKAFLWSGTGATMPQSVFNSPAMITEAGEDGQAVSTIVYPNVTKMWSQLSPESMGSAVWVASNSAIPQLHELVLPVGTGGSGMFLAVNQAAPTPTLFGAPLLFSEKLPALGAAGTLMLIDFSKYAVGMRSEMQIDVDPYTDFKAGIIGFKATTRVDGRSLWDTTSTGAVSDVVTSPFISLGAIA